jgi:FlaG/FlaF family flagellin (archaellin)
MKTKTKGLEPIVAAVLLIVVAVIGAVLIYLWFAGYVTKATSQAESMAVSEKLKIEAASLTAGTGGSGTATLYIRNLGGDTVKLVHAYVLRPGSISPVCSQSIDPAETIDPGEMSTITVTLTGCTLDAGYDYVIKIVTQKGTEFAVTVTAS